MQKKDWVAAGIKLIGIYVAAMAAIGASAAVLNTLIALIFSGGRPEGVGFFKMLGVVFVKVLLVGLVVPAAQGVVAWLLLKKTCWCLQKAGIGEESPQM